MQNAFEKWLSEEEGNIFRNGAEWAKLAWNAAIEASARVSEDAFPDKSAELIRELLTARKPQQCP